MAVEDPGPAEYALLQSLFVNSETQYPRNPHYIAKLLQSSTLISSPVELADPTDLQSLVIPDPLFSSENDFQGAAADEVLAHFVKVYEEEEVFKLALESTFVDVRFLQAARRLDVPLLKSDPRHDLKALARIIAEAKHHGFFCKPSSLPLEPVDERKDEGLGIPGSAMRFHHQLTRGAEPDELDFSVEDLLYVSESLHDEWTDKDSGNDRVRIMTPPLIAPPLNESDEVDIFVPNTEFCEIDNLSEPQSLLSEDLERVMKNLSNEYDDPRLSDASASDIIGVASDTPSFEAFNPKHQDAGMEIPIFPRSDDTISNSQEEQCFRALIGSVPRFDFRNPSEDQLETPIDEDESSFNEQFGLLIKYKANSMTRRLEQEQVEAVDAVARMQPPLLGFGTSAPDWQGAMQNPSAMFLWITRSHKDEFRSSQWPRNPQEQKDLRWVPFLVPLTKVDVRESVGSSYVLQDVFGARGPGPLPTSADYVRRRCHLKVLSEDSDEELSISCQDHPQELNLRGSGDGVMDLIRKRKMTQVAEGGPKNMESPTIGVKSRRTASNMIAANFLDEGLLLGENDTNAAGRLLSNYMNLRAAKRPKPSTGSFTTAPGTSTATSLCPSTSRRATQNAPKPRTPQLETRIVYANAPYPPVEVLKQAPRIVISVSLPRCIISALQAKIPGIDLVDRDFTSHNTWSWSPGSTNRMENHSPLSYEADIIPSPATGIIITTILKVRQKTLPGSKAQVSQIRQRLTRVAPLYERVIVLVSEGNPTGEQAGPLDGADAEAYASFVAFASSLGSSGCSVRTLYVAGGSQTLANWTCALVATHAKEVSSNVQQIIMSEETEWEVFLRRAGLNMYAAQVTLAVVKGTCLEDGEDRTLVRFLGMSSAERANLLRDFLGGGCNLIERVSARLD
ncbi:hypothetical protein CSPAE12_02529 [Colletotrichum incanum]|nr:hypothetical protein CSPAE12_02529 [Colletotrichum incanum]